MASSTATHAANDNKTSLPEKLKLWFKGSKSSGAPSSLSLRTEQLEGLDSNSSLLTRLRIAKELTPLIRVQQLNAPGPQLLYMKSRDMLFSRHLTEAQKLVVNNFYLALIEGQYEWLDVMRVDIVRLIEKHVDNLARANDDSEDQCSSHLDQPILLLDALTKRGCNVVHVEERLAPLLALIFTSLRSVEVYLEPNILHILLELLLNAVKYNPSCFESVQLSVTIDFLSTVAIWPKDRKGDEGNDLCLQCCFAIMGFSYVPLEALPAFISMLCRLLNCPKQCKEAWRVTRSLLETHLGHRALQVLCEVLQCSDNHSDALLMRGAIFCLGTCLWSDKCVPKFHCYSPMSILPPMAAPLNHSGLNGIVLYELALQLKGLGLCGNRRLRGPDLDAALDVLLRLLIVCDSKRHHLKDELYTNIQGAVDDFFVVIHSVIQESKYLGDVDKYYEVVNAFSHNRPELLTLEGLRHVCKKITPFKPGWMRCLLRIVERHFNEDQRQVVRLEALSEMQKVVLDYARVYEEELVDVVVVPCLSNAHIDSDAEVRLRAVEVLSAICKICRSKKSLLLLDALDHFLERPKLNPEKSTEEGTDNMADVHLAAVKLVELFTLKLDSQNNQGLEVAKIFAMLVKLLENCYEEPNAYSKSGEVRLVVLKFLVSLRGNQACQLGIFLDSGSLLFSKFVLTSSSESSLIVIPIHRATELFVRALRNERDWAVVNFLLIQLPQVFQNKMLRSSTVGGLHSFVSPLVDLVMGSKHVNYPDCLLNSPKSLSRSDFCNKVYPLLAVLASYSDQLESSSHRALITTLNQGLLYRDCCRQCILALTTCALELKRTLYHLIPQVLQNFAKISATKHVAIPMLEFLSTLMRLKDIFSSFNDTQYRSIFALTLPFTNALKFSSYTVSLAHHVLIMWYLKCRPSYRQNFVHFIIAGLNANVAEARMNEFRKPVVSTSAAPNKNDHDNADKIRKRSSSLSDRANGARDRVLNRLAVNKARGGVAAGSSPSDGAVAGFNEREKMAKFHEELIETSVDILSRYMFANVSVRPRTSRQRSFFLREGNSATWVLGTTLVTITTNSCDLNATRASLCDMCHLTCSKMRETDKSVDEREQGATSTLRMRHQSELQKSSSANPEVGSLAELDDKRQFSIEAVSTEMLAPQATKDGNDKSTELESILESSRSSEEKRSECCACWCTGWAEILVRRPSGDTAWLCRVQNPSLVSDTHATDVNFGDISTLMQPLMRNDNHPKEPDSGRKAEEDEFQDQIRPLGNQEAVPSTENVERKDKTPSVPTSPTSSSTKAKTSEDPMQCKTIAEVTEEDANIPSKSPVINDLRLLRRTSLQPEGQEAPPRLLTLSTCLPLGATNRGSSTRHGISSNPSTPSPSSRMTHHQQPPLPTSEQSRPQQFPRDRAHTISGPSPRRNIKRSPKKIPQESVGPTTERISGVSPQFVFLQLYLNGAFNKNESNNDNVVPLLIPQERSVLTSIKILDSIYPHETFKVGLVYHGPGCGQDEALTLSSSFGSLRYFAFMTSLGKLISLKENNKDYYVGGLRNADGDGDWALVWEDDVMQVVFHCATLMPTNHLGKDPKCNKKKRHVGNDYVVIVYNDDPETNVAFGLISSQVTAVYIIIDPLDNGVSSVRVRCKPELDETLEHLKEPRLVSERNLSVLVRQLSLHCNLAAHIHASFGSGREIYASNWLERLRHIKRLREKVIKYNKQDGDSGEIGVARDFTPLVMRQRKS